MARTDKPYYTLGLCTMGNSAAALFKDQRLISAVEEERLSRIKNDNNFPHLAIKEVLSIEGIDITHINCIAIYWQPWRIFTRSLGTLKKFIKSPVSRKSLFNKTQIIFQPSSITNGSSWYDLFFIKNIIKKNHGEFHGRLEFHDHHKTHKAYGKSLVDFQNFISLSFDGGGESNSTVLSVFSDKKEKIISVHKWPNSLGHFYSTFTGFLGFKILEGEYKMMGLAPYGKPIYKDLIFSNILKLKKNGRYSINTELCNYHNACEGIFHQDFINIFGPRRTNKTPTKHDLDLASSVQYVFEKVLEHILKPAMEQYPYLDKIVLTGGCALNVTANGKLMMTKNFNKVVIPPAPHDAGCSVGAAICSLNKYPEKNSIKNPYLGRKFSEKNLLETIREYCKVIPNKKSEKDLINCTVDLLVNGKLVAWFQGKSEFGPRALGARSFLADPRKESIRDQINLKIKKRELFRPFAPSVLLERKNDFFDLKVESPYMNLIATVIDNSAPAITHIDKTARVHTVNLEDNKRYYKLIKKFGEKTGVPILLNTSFNIQEPIVYSPKDAFKTFINSKVDVLVIEDFIIERSHLRLDECS